MSLSTPVALSARVASVSSNDDGELASPTSQRPANHTRSLSSFARRPAQMPDWWKADHYIRTKPTVWRWFWVLEALWLQGLSVIAFGNAGLEPLWENLWDKERLSETKDHLQQQINNTNIMSGLLLATVAVFITADTSRDDMLKVTALVPYVLMLLAFGMAMGSILGGCVLLMVVARTTPTFFLDITSSRIKLHFTLALIGYPLASVAVACNATGAGLLVASALSPHRYIAIGAGVLVAIPWSLFLVFSWLALKPAKQVFRRSALHKKDVENLGTIVDDEKSPKSL